MVVRGPDSPAGAAALQQGGRLDDLFPTDNPATADWHAFIDCRGNTDKQRAASGLERHKHARGRGHPRQRRAGERSGDCTSPSNRPISQRVEHGCDALESPVLPSPLPSEPKATALNPVSRALKARVLGNSEHVRGLVLSGRFRPHPVHIRTRGLEEVVELEGHPVDLLAQAGRSAATNTPRQRGGIPRRTAGTSAGRR